MPSAKPHLLRTSASIAALAVTALLTGTALAETPAQVAQSQLAQAPAVPKAAPPAPGLPVLDPAVNPCDNFFQHACGPWIQANPIPAKEASWGSFGVLRQKNDEILKGILENAVAKPTPETRKIGDMYKACMDEAGIEAKGLAPVKPHLERIAAFSDKKDLTALLVAHHNAGVSGFFGFGQQQDGKDATMAIAVVSEGGLGLPERDFYLRDDERTKGQRAAYVAHVATMFQLAGDSAETAKAKAERVLAFETTLANAWKPREERRQREKRYNKKPVAELATIAPVVDWVAYAKGRGAPAFDSLNVTDPEYFAKIAAVLGEADLESIRDYLSFHTLRDAAPLLSKAFVDASFDFYSRTLSGVQEQRPRWQRCVAMVNGALGEDLGKHYVDIAFGPKHKERMLVLVADVQDAFYQNIDNLDWMSEATKVKAREKAKSMQNKIGYPDKWRDYSKLEIKADDAFGNALRATAFVQDWQLSKIGKPVERGEWAMTPPTVNAYYSSTFNDINFPAGILQPPFFDFAADDAYNYGAIGGVIGHEITHGFDDQGRKSDAFGNLNNWWTAEDEKKFVERAQCLVDQYGSYVADGDVKLNGRATLGENTADNGGLRVAYQALEKRLGSKMAEKIGGLTAAQRFFYGWAHVWCTNFRPEAKVQQARTGVHSLGEYRVNGTLSNMAEFSKAFNCPASAPMNRGDKACKVW